MLGLALGEDALASSGAKAAQPPQEEIPTLIDRLRFVEVLAGEIGTPEGILVVDVLRLLDMATGQQEGDILPILSFLDKVRARETLDSRLTISEKMTDRAGLSDEIAAVWQADQSDRLRFGETFAVDMTAGWTDRVRARDAVVANVGVSHPWSDVLRWRDVVGFGDSASLTDRLQLAERVDTVWWTVAPALVDRLRVIEPLALSTALVSAWMDPLLARDALSGALDLQAAVAWDDRLRVLDWIGDDEIYQLLVAINAETGAVSTYTLPVAITGLAEYRGKLYLTSPDGLYALDASQDEDGRVLWSLRTGFSQWGSDAIKRVNDLNVQGRLEGDLIFETVSDRAGEKKAHRYQLIRQNRTSYRDGVIAAGKGVTSVYWQIALQGAGPAEIDRLQVAYETLSRRR